MKSYSQWQDLTALATGNGPMSGPPPLIRDALEADRLAWRHTPDAMYPDGYLGTIKTRREDRLNHAVWRNSRSYQRGVHKGERLDMSSYLWPEEFNLWSGVANQATTGQRFVSPAFAQEPVVLVNDGRPGPRDIGQPNNGTPVQTDPNRVERLVKVLPPWR